MTEEIDMQLGLWLWRQPIENAAPGRSLGFAAPHDRIDAAQALGERAAGVCWSDVAAPP